MAKKFELLNRTIIKVGGSWGITFNTKIAKRKNFKLGDIVDIVVKEVENNNDEDSNDGEA